MRPILLKGHERCVSRRCVEALLALSPHARSAHSPLTFLKYNVEGDLLMTCAKDHTPNLWYADDGERIGTYSGHNGAVWTCDLTGAWPAGAVGLRAVR
jgi:translation initiation factor 3 subunit I